eukprot:15367074-Ditylum_brightwellii.AAC.1
MKLCTAKPLGTNRLKRSHKTNGTRIEKYAQEAKSRQEKSAKKRKENSHKIINAHLNNMHLFSFRNHSVTILIAIAYGVSHASAACPNEPSSTEKLRCEQVQNWSDLKKIVRTKDRVVLCPFVITLTDDDTSLKLKKKHELICANEGGCVIEGGSSHVKILSSSADVSFYGFTFKEATKSSILVAGSADKNEHSLCYSTFDSNGGLRGPAIKGADGTELFIFQSNFVRNEAKFGTVYSEGKVEVVDSVFEDNFSKKGSALYLTGSGEVTIGGTTFKDNTGRGHFISLDYGVFNSNGGNTGSGNTGICGADGAYIRQGKECVNFSGRTPGPTPAPTPSPPTPNPPSDGNYPVHPVPNNPPPGYFNYDMNDMKYGPNAWHKIPASQTDAYKYWKDLENYMPANLKENTCNSQVSFNDNRASPVNLRNTDDNCKEYHQLRPNRMTDHGPLLGPGSVGTLEIKSHSLRISYPRVDKDDLTVPSADIPQGWGKFLHVAYCEFKVPASHTLQGETFAAEMNCYIIQKAGRGLGVFTILFKIGSFNKLLDEAICSFQSVWQKDKNACSGGGRRDLEEDGKDDDDVFDDDDDDVAPRNHESTINWMIENLIFREDPQGN